MARKEFPRKVKRAAIDRANGHCERCKAALKPGEAEVDHILPDALGGEPTLANAMVLCRVCHRGPDGKTTQDVRRIRKADRQRDKATGAMRAKSKIRSAGFPSTGKTPRITRNQLPPKPLFREVNAE